MTLIWSTTTLKSGNKRWAASCIMLKDRRRCTTWGTGTIMAHKVTNWKQLHIPRIILLIDIEDTSRNDLKSLLRNLALKETRKWERWEKSLTKCILRKSRLQRKEMFTIGDEGGKMAGEDRPQIRYHYVYRNGRPQEYHETPVPQGLTLTRSTVIHGYIEQK